MKAIIYDGFGDLSVIKLVDQPSPVLKPGQVRICVRASGLNRADLVQRKGYYPPPPGESEIPGLEVSGEILETEATSTKYAVGDRVIALVAGGGYAEEVTVDEGMILPLPPALSFVQGAAIPEAFLTSHHNLFYLGKAAPGQDVLIHSGASGIGTAALQLLRAIKCRTFTTVGNAEKAEFCRTLGAQTILYKKEDFSEVVLKATEQKGVHLILDTIGGSYLEKNIKSLALGGTSVLIGLMGGDEGKLDLGALLTKRARIIGSTLRNLPLAEKRAVVERFTSQFSKLLVVAAIKPVVDEVFSPEEVQKAQSRMEKNENTGKIIIEWK